MSTTNENDEPTESYDHRLTDSSGHESGTAAADARPADSTSPSGYPAAATRPQPAPGSYSATGPYGGSIPPTPAAPAGKPKRRNAILITTVAAAVVIGLGGQGLAAVAVASAFTRLSETTSASQGSTGTTPINPYSGDSGFGSSGSGSSGDGTTTPGGQGFPGFPDSGSTGSTDIDATAATADQEVGVVTIDTKLQYDQAEAAGTGMILTSDCLILTNNHVVEDSTSIQVTVESTGKTYTADVVGTDATADVAVLQLENASGLHTVKFDTKEAAAVGDDVYSVGNANGTGDLLTATGSITAVDQSITVNSEFTSAGESLANLIEVDSDVVSGDSGGPLFDDDGDVIGIVTAASSGSTDISGYAIEIDAVLSVVKQIESGVESDTVQIGYPAFLGIQLATTTDATTAGATVGGVIEGTPAASSGLVAGDVITAVDGTAAASAAELSAAIAAHEPGDSVQLTWTTATGTSQSASVTLIEGPAA